MSAHLRLVQPYDEPTVAVHRNQFAQRVSFLPLGYWHRPWYTKRVWRLTAIGVLILALIGLWALRSTNPSW